MQALYAGRTHGIGIATLAGALLLMAIPFAGNASSETIYPDRPTVLAFAPEPAKFVRLEILRSSGGEPCIDELEVYAAGGEQNLAVQGGVASASSCIAGYAIHKIEHLNDGAYGNVHSWISGAAGESWAQIELPEAVSIDRVVFSRDRDGVFRDRVPESVEVRLSLDGQTWKTVATLTGTAAGAPKGAPKFPSPLPLPLPAVSMADATELDWAWLGEEHAWLKMDGRADLNPSLVPYNGRVKEYPRHAEDDRLPLPEMQTAPVLDGRVDETEWRDASRGVVRVAAVDNPKAGALVEQSVLAGIHADSLWLGIQATRLLSAHVAVVADPDWKQWGIVAVSEGKLVFNTYDENGAVAASVPLEGGMDAGYTCIEVRLPVSVFPREAGTPVVIGLGIGGRHTPSRGRGIAFTPSPLYIRESSPCVNGSFMVTVGRSAGDTDATAKHVTCNVSGEEAGFDLTPGVSRAVRIQGEPGRIGPRFNLKVKDGGDAEYQLALFHYNPVGLVLTQYEELIERLKTKEVPVTTAWSDLVRLRGANLALHGNANATPDQMRALLSAARMVKRNTFMRDPDLSAVQRVLFAKRFPFRPSHNYSDYFDAPFNPGGGIYVADIPWQDGRCKPDAVSLTKLFDAGEGIARTPAASYDLKYVYFGYRPTADGYYHIQRVNADGTGLTPITDGPFHDFWPCPLPDGGLAFITTRCTCRVFCWRPQSSVLFRMDADGGNMRPLSLASLTEWAPSVMRDGRIIWTRWEYVDKAADFGHTLWTIRPDGSYPELMYGNTIIQPNGYANGREVPGTHEICCTLISHFGDLNGPIAMVDIDKGRFNPKAIQCITPEVPWPGAPPAEECFRDPMPISRDLVLCSYAPQDRFGLFVIDRYGNRELLYSDPAISCMCPTLFRVDTVPPVLAAPAAPEPADAEYGEFIMTDVSRGLEQAVAPGTVKYVRVVEEVRHGLNLMPDGGYRKDHESFFDFYASPVDRVSGPNGWPAYVAKTPMGIVPVEADGSVHFRVPAGKVLYFEALDKDFNEIQRMRSVIQLQAGERRSCIGCHEPRQNAPANQRVLMAKKARDLETLDWEGTPISFERVVQPVLDAHCVKCHNAEHPKHLDFRGVLDEGKVPASYRTLIEKGLVHYADCGWNSGGCERLEPLSFGTLKSPLWDVLNAGHNNVTLTTDEMRRIKTWIDLNCPLWPDYTDRNLRVAQAASAP